MRKFKIGSLLVVLALVVTIILGWCHSKDRMTVENWGVPIDYKGDAPQILSWIEAAKEGDYVPFWTEEITRLGAPYHANWNDYPMYEKILTFCLGMTAKKLGLFVTSNFAVLLAHVLSAISFYFCCRFLKHPKTWSFVGAVLFSFTYYNFFRGLGHLLLAYSYIVPWALLTCWIITGSRQMQVWDKLSKVCMITSLAMGLSNPYNLNIYMQLLCLGILYQWFVGKRKENIKVGLICVGIAGAAFLAINSGTLAYNFEHGKNPSAMDRHYFESELYALKPMEFFIPPPTHIIPALADIGSKYIAGVYVRGEICSPYLGIVGIAGLFWVFGESLLIALRGIRSPKPFPPHALQTLWVIFYSLVGGANCILSFCGIQFFRGTNRHSLFVSTIILLFLVAKVSRWSLKWSQGKNLLFAALVLMVGAMDEMPRRLAPEETIAWEKDVENDKVFGREMESKLPSATMVFQLPVMEFPEAVPINEVTGYEMLRPYFVTKNLRFSFGSARGRNREAWQWEVERLPVPEMIATLQKYGFGAIYMNRKGYKDHGDELLKQFAAEGITTVCTDPAGDQVCLPLKPSASPEFPHTDDRAQILYRSGWVIKQHNHLESQEWSSGDASLSFFSESRQATGYNLRCFVGAISSRQVSLVMNGTEIWKGEVPAGQSVPVNVTITGRHGNNSIQLKTDRPGVLTKDFALPLAFTIVNLQITKL